MRVSNWIFRLGFLIALAISGGVFVPTDASDMNQVVTRGKPQKHNPPKHNPPKHNPPKPKPPKKEKVKVKKLKKIPSSYTRVYHKNKYYYYHDGFFFRPCANGYYESFRPFIGMYISILPPRAYVIFRGGEKLMVCEGVIYKRIPTPHGVRYKVVGFM